MAWTAGDNGTWIGGSVTVTLSCTIANDEPFAGAGRTVSATRHPGHRPVPAGLRRVREF